MTLNAKKMDNFNRHNYKLLKLKNFSHNIQIQNKNKNQKHIFCKHIYKDIVVGDIFRDQMLRFYKYIYKVTITKYYCKSKKRPRSYPPSSQTTNFPHLRPQPTTSQLPLTPPTLSPPHPLHITRQLPK